MPGMKSFSTIMPKPTIKNHLLKGLKCLYLSGRISGTVPKHALFLPFSPASAAALREWADWRCRSSDKGAVEGAAMDHLVCSRKSPGLSYPKFEPVFLGEFRIGLFKRSSGERSDNLPVFIFREGPQRLRADRPGRRDRQHGGGVDFVAWRFAEIAPHLHPGAV